MNYADMTDGELYDAAVAAGMEFSLMKTGDLCVGSGLLGWDAERTQRVCRIDREIRTRWGRFVAFAKLKLWAGGEGW